MQHLAFIEADGPINGAVIYSASLALVAACRVVNIPGRCVRRPGHLRVPEKQQSCRRQAARQGLDRYSPLVNW